MELSPGLTAFCLTLFWIEFVGDIALIIVSLFVLSLVRRCAVLHWNLKTFLICKCLMSLMLGCCRVVHVFPIIQTGSLTTIPLLVLSFLQGIAINTNNYLCVAYTAERIFATVFVKTYERQRPYFGVLFSLIIVAITTYNAGKETLWRSSGTYNATYGWNTILSCYAFNVSGLVCVLAIIYLHRYNLRGHSNRFARRSIAGLAERYQNCENVRTTRHLLPVIFMHLVSSITASMYFTAGLIWGDEQSRYFQRIALSFSNFIIYLLCQLAMVYFHPSLRKHACTMLSKAISLCRCRVGDVSVAPSTEHAHVAGLDGEQMLTRPDEEGDAYFTNLTILWESRYDSISSTKDTE